jgi:chromosome segregation ATPase
MAFSIFQIMSKTLTYEQMMALFAEGRKETAEIRKSMAERDAKAAAEIAEIRKSMAERDARADERLTRMEAGIARLEAITEKTNARVDETNARVDETNARLDETIAEMRENTAQMKINNRNMGFMTNKLGDIVESIVLPDIVEKFNEKGFKFDSVRAGVEFLNEKKNGNLAEVDALLENGKFVIVVETKTEMKQKDVNDHIKRLNALRGLPRFKGKKIYGALATAIAKKRPVNYALGKGFYVLQQPDVMGVKILDFPKGHCAKAW